MAQSTFTSVVLAKRPKGPIVVGETFALKQNPVVTEKDLKEEEVLVEVLYLSLDPAMRGWLNGMFLISFLSCFCDVSCLLFHDFSVTHCHTPPLSLYTSCIMELG